MHGLIAWFARNDVAANLLMLVIVIAGLYSLSNKIPIDLFPEFEINTVQVSAVLPGASPQEVEEGLTIKIEEAIQDIPGIREMTSRSNEGSSSVTVEVEDGFDVRELLDEMKSRVDAINNFPVEAERPLVTMPQRKRDAIGVVMYGDYDSLTLRRLAEDVRDELAALPEVSQVSVDNSLRFEISIEIPEWSLRKYDLTLEQVADALRRNSTDVSAGNLKTAGGDIFIRSIGQAYRASDFSQLPILTDNDGTLIRLGDIAVLRDEFEETPLRTRFNGIPAIEVEVFRVGDQSIIDVTDAVKNYILAKQGALPEGLTMTYWRDRSKSIKARLATLTKSAWQGALLVILLLALFLRPAVALWVCIGIPMSFMGAFILMPVFGISLNLMSLFAFILVLGIVVDDAIVTGENVYEHMQRGTDPLTAAIKGTQEVAVPVTFGILTTVAAFIPLALLDGRGSWYQSIPYVIVPVLLFSLIESKLVLPAHLKHIKPRTGAPSRLTRVQMAISKSLETFIANFYQPALALALRWRYATLAIMLSSLFIIIGALASGQTKFVFFPRVQSEVATATLTMPAGTAFESTDRIVAHMTKQAQLLQAKYIDPELGESIIKNIYSISGGRNSSTGRVRVETIPPEDRSLEIGTQQLVAEWRKMVGQVAGAEQLNYRAEIGWSRPAINIELRGKNADDLAALGQKFKGKLSEFSAVSDVEDSMSDGKEELQLKLKSEATLLGLNLNMVARQVRQAVYGFEVQRIQRGREEVRVMVRYPIAARQSIETLEQMMIRVGERQEVPLWQIADIVPGLSPSSILRIDRQRTLSITADFNKEQGNLSAVQEELSEFLQQAISGYPGLSYEMAGEARDQKESSQELKFGMYGLLLVIYILLAIPFKSYSQPLVVMMVIPFGMVGAVIGHWIMGMDLTLLSLMGVLALSGVVVNDSLVLVDYINKKRSEGAALFDAVYAAGGRRFRPVLLTSLTTFAGLMPLLFEKSTQAQFLIPMAVSLGFGILFATIITLFLVPINYLIMEDIKRYSVRYKNDMAWLIRKGVNKIKPS
ncbi:MULTISPECIES: efflux RND transporter permease subunit [unclassified Colwellia]|uniref:efflux RND transporter permease subunit n=1 Tax=unclassified Colwellia TaxID=196834 RepID=UPI0015F620BE|nr:MULTISPECIES: efflux RND transporter permease subunit [unclassified Colwellia]MBA6231924.1 efflux RND transporter permease subunit [Colwellia sp. MB02u-7]MBA6235903.1 efflux RND transporter permease subunit [Colwellia sp. MB02u-11]MBA6255261.1 efflux RND transporter permease subunit [Colwellia sp. MB3u-28]MBA6258574.1 efflux RND transporter permease subunit [Colwellia sp. MB3u-41]MBA6298682.1 efflux RND transporter permease subunit [Colwellia sp. MB3u-22]